MKKAQLANRHSLIQDTIFRLKSLVLIVFRVFKNVISPAKKFKIEQDKINQPVFSVSESDLWNPSDNSENWILTAGKIENLRIAAKKIHGLEIKANEVFSFWKHIGNPNFGKGFVVGREIREGCIIPTIAGGLCQLSNALYDAALKANFVIVERHKHTKVIKGSLAEKNRDATVKWNYLDLRFKSTCDFRIEIELTADKFRVSFKSEQFNNNSKETVLDTKKPHNLNDCYSCGNLACFKYPERLIVKQEIATTTFILDEKWPEYDQYIKEIRKESDHFILPVKKNRFIKTNRYTWKAANPLKTKTTVYQGFLRAFKLRFTPKNKNNVFELALRLDKKIAQAAVKKIQLDSTHVVIAQNLLPFVFETGALGGRTFDVLMTRLPLEKLHERLDFAFSIHGESTTLNDFRAPVDLLNLENEALNKARRIITPHAEIAGIFSNKSVKLDWEIPPFENKTVLGNKILFPASAVGRKGAYEIKKLAKELQLTISFSGRNIEDENFWEDVSTERFDGDLNQIGLIIYPTFIEHQPRQILSAIAKGIPVITTTACGFESSSQIKVLEMNNFEQFKKEFFTQMKIH